MADELDGAVKKASQERADALFVPSDHLFLARADRIMRTALQYHLPAMVEGPDMIEAGGLISYSMDVTEARSRRAAIVDRILRGAKPGELPVEQPTKFELIVNLRTAKALGLTVPPSTLERADRVIR